MTTRRRCAGSVEPNLALSLAEAAADMDMYRRERDAYIKRAMDEGASAREVAELAGISHTWVLKIWRDQT